MPPTDTPTPTHTPVPPTETATPTHTPAPPTDTPTPTKTSVPPTDTPVPTNTPAPAPPTSTPIPAVSPAEAHAEQGFSYFEEKRWAEAIAEFEEAIRLDPGFGVAYLGLGYSYALGPEDLAKAITALEKYLQLVPGASNRAQVEADIQTMREMLAAQPSISIPPGKGALVMFNCRGGDTITVDIIPVGILQELAPKTGPDCYQGEPIFLDPGEYVLKAAIAGVPSFGEQGITIVAGDALQFTWY